MNKSKDYYTKIDTVLKEYEEYKPYHDKTVDWAADYIDWCWKWRKITEAQMQELSERVVKIYTNIL